MTSLLRGYTLANNPSTRPTIGDTKTSAVAVDHLGWLVCDYRLLNVADYRELFNVIGYSFGGSGTQFRLPNAAGRVAGFAGTGTDVNSVTQTFNFGDSIGEYTHRLTVAELPSGNVGNTSLTVSPATVVTTGNNVTVQSGTGATVIGSLNNTTATSISPNPHTHTIGGSDTRHNTVQPTIVIGNLFIYGGRKPGITMPYTTGIFVLPPDNVTSNRNNIQ